MDPPTTILGQAKVVVVVEASPQRNFAWVREAAVQCWRLDYMFFCVLMLCVGVLCFVVWFHHKPSPFQPLNSQRRNGDVCWFCQALWGSVELCRTDYDKAVRGGRGLSAQTTMVPARILGYGFTTNRRHLPKWKPTPFVKTETVAICQNGNRPA
jgi:hypothetical protein